FPCQPLGAAALVVACRAAREVPCVLAVLLDQKLPAFGILACLGHMPSVRLLAWGRREGSSALLAAGLGFRVPRSPLGGFSSFRCAGTSPLATRYAPLRYVATAHASNATRAMAARMSTHIGGRSVTVMPYGCRST